MRFRQTNSELRISSPRVSVRQRRCAGFTLAEVLAALVFMAIVIPVSVQGVRIAALAGTVGERKATAALIADRMMNELIVTGQWMTGSPSGTVTEGAVAYEWEALVEPWTFGAMSLMTVEVRFLVQGREYDVQLSTLVDSSR